MKQIYLSCSVTVICSWEKFKRTLSMDSDCSNSDSDLSSDEEMSESEDTLSSSCASSEEDVVDVQSRCMFHALITNCYAD